MILRALVIVSSVLLVSGCQFMEPGIPGSGTIKTEVRTIDDFDQVSFAGSGRLSVEVGASEVTCVIECDDNLLEFIETEVVDGRLKIHTSRNVAPTMGINARLTTRNLSKLSLAGSCDAEVTGLNEEKLGVHLAGSGDITCSGNVNELDVHLAGSGSLESLGLNAENVTIHIAGSGDARVNAANNLKVSIAGSGEVRYTGTPEIKESVAGSGSVEKISE